MRIFRRAAAFLLAVACGLPWMLSPPVQAAADPPDLTTQYRVYQNNTALQEFIKAEDAIRYARQFTNTYVENIQDRQWTFHFFPRYRIYQNGRPIFKPVDTLEKAIGIAKQYANSSVKDITRPGWVWENYTDPPRYRVYQDLTSLDDWAFEELDAAIREAKKWAHSHIIDTRGNGWVWDNLTEAEIAERRNGPKVFKVYVHDISEKTWEFGHLKDAIELAQQWDHTLVLHKETNRIVHQDVKPYQVLQTGKRLEAFYTLDDALDYANRWDHAEIMLNKRSIWNNSPYFRVEQQDQTVGEYHQIDQAVTEALKLNKALIRTVDDEIVWDNRTRLAYWAWTGTAREETIKAQVANTTGLDVISPTWFFLEKADGTLNDQATPDMVRWLHRRGLEVHPLVHNQFSAGLTSAFLSDAAAQNRFIEQLVSRSAALGVDGINVDFEGLAGKDRDKYTAFLRKLTEAAHTRQLTVSVDLPRGSLEWNHLTAYDHTALAGFIDYIIIMAYDQYWSGSKEPGAVSGLGWSQGGIEQFLSYGMQRDKLIMGIPFYIRVWQLDPSGKLVDNRAIFASKVEELLAGREYEMALDDRFGLHRVQYVDDQGHTHVFWLENAESLQARLNLAKQYRLGGVAAWRLGYEPGTFWQLMVHEKNE